MILTATTGILWNKYRLKRIFERKGKSWLEFYIFGLITHVIMILCMFTLPTNLAFETLEKTLIPVMVMYPLASLALCIIIFKKVIQRRAESLLSSLLNSIPDLIFYKDPNNVYMGCNKAFADFVRVSEYDLIGLTAFDLFEQETASKYTSMDMELMKNKLPIIHEEEITYPDDIKVILEIGISRDITERRQKEQKIQYMTSHDRVSHCKDNART